MSDVSDVSGVSGVSGGWGVSRVIVSVSQVAMCVAVVSQVATCVGVGGVGQASAMSAQQENMEEAESTLPDSVGENEKNGENEKVRETGQAFQMLSLSYSSNKDSGGSKTLPSAAFTIRADGRSLVSAQHAGWHG